MIENIDWIDVILMIGGYIVLLSTSGKVLDYILSKISGGLMIEYLISKVTL